MKNLAIAVAGLVIAIVLSVVTVYTHRLDVWWGCVVEFWSIALATVVAAVAWIYFCFWLYDIQ